MVTMPDTPILDPVYSLEDPKRLSQTDLTSCHLALQVGGTHFSYAILDPATNTFIALRAFYLDPEKGGSGLLESIEAYLHQERILYTAFREIRLAFDSANFCLVPKKFYDPELKRDYLSALFEEQHGLVYLDNTSSFTSFHVVYAVDKNLIGFLRKEFGTDRIFHAQHVFLEQIIHHPDVTSGQAVCFIRVLHGFFTITFFHKGTLLLSQSHRMQKESDVAYHLLLAGQQLLGDTLPIQLYISGDMDETSPVCVELGKYFAEIHWLDRLDSFQYIDAFNQYNPYMFYSLTSLLSCES